MKEVTDALLIMELPLKSVTSSLLYNVSEIKQFMKHAGVERIMFSSVKTCILLSFFTYIQLFQKNVVKRKAKKAFKLRPKGNMGFLK